MYVFKPKPKTEKALLREAASARNARRLNAEILKEEMEFQKKLKGGVKWTPENLEYRRKVGLA